MIGSAGFTCPSPAQALHLEGWDNRISSAWLTDHPVLVGESVGSYQEEWIGVLNCRPQKLTFADVSGALGCSHGSWRVTLGAHQAGTSLKMKGCSSRRCPCLARPSFLPRRPISTKCQVRGNRSPFARSPLHKSCHLASSPCSCKEGHGLMSGLGRIVSLPQIFQVGFLGEELQAPLI